MPNQPRSVRNSWVKIETSSRKGIIGAGPTGAEGWLKAQFYVRHQGKVIESVRIETFIDGNFQDLVVFDPSGRDIFRQHTDLARSVRVVPLKG